VELAGDRSDELVQPALYVGVHVLERGVERERAALQLVHNLLEALHQLPGLGVGDDAGAREHARVRDAAAHVLAEQRAVHVDRGGEALHARIGRLGEAAAPGLGSSAAFRPGAFRSGARGPGFALLRVGHAPLGPTEDAGGAGVPQGPRAPTLWAC